MARSRWRAGRRTFQYALDYLVLGKVAEHSRQVRAVYVSGPLAVRL